MLRRSKKVIMWLLTGIMIFSVAFSCEGIVANAAIMNQQVEATENQETSFTDYNEYAFGSYEEAVAASDSLTAQTNGDEIVDSANSVEATADYVKCSSVAAAGKYVREAMAARKSTIEFNFRNSAGYSAETAYRIIKDEVFKETGVYNQGAYLVWNWGGNKVYYDYQDDGSILFNIKASYLSTPQQEKLIDAEVARLLNNEFAGWENMHDYEKVKMVYKWMTTNFKYVEGANNHSTYSGMINHRTVCQGFATSMYRLLGEMGLNVRVVANDVHGWNIVQLGQYWYSLDATWDVGKTETRWAYFLTDYTLFTIKDHTRGAEYDTAEYHEDHPMASGAYDYSAHRDAVGVDYRTHVEGYGWQNFVYDGSMSGTEGESKRLEGIEIKLGNTGAYDIGVAYQTHIERYGWETVWKENGQMSGTSGESKRLEAIRIKLTGADADKFDIYYRVHAESYGWLGWAKNGQESGTAGQSKRLEGIQILILEKGQTPGYGILGYSYIDYGKNSKSADAAMGLVNYRTHVEQFGWQGFVYDGSISGTSGLSKRLEGITINLGNTGYEGGIRYTTHVEQYGWQGDKDNPETWRKDGEMSGTSGESKRLEGIRIQLYGEVAEHYDVYYRVHAESFGWLGWAQNGADAGTAGLSKRLEAIQIVILPKGSSAPGSTARAFVTK
ncbi:MAG: hypothetical protein IKJ73_07425 [Lachnospiraceae bacterium]|nr:hypothetical protein [Lachnospiraceae bacterium]